MTDIFSNDSSINMVSVIGAGTMGHGIAESVIMSGRQAVLIDINETLLKVAGERIKWSLEKLKEKGKVAGEVSDMMPRLSYETDIRKGVSEADLIIEAVPEILDLKHDVFKQVDRAAPYRAILATNTSSLPITEIAAVTGRPERVVGMHFFNPAPLMPLVEITKGNMTADYVIASAYEFAKFLGKEPVVVKKDVTGFIVNRIIARLYNAACWEVAEDGHTIEQVDATLRYKLDFPMGAFELADFSGIDIIYYMLEIMMKRGYRMHPCPLFEEKFRAGQLGVKSGAGFYSYPDPRAKPKISPEVAGKVDPLRMLAPLVNEAAWLISNGAATEEDIDKAFTLGLGYPRGLSSYIHDFGPDRIIFTLRSMAVKKGWIEYEPDSYLISMQGGQATT